MPYVYSHPVPEFHEETDLEYGLKLPDGTEIWPPERFQDRAGFATAEEREIVRAGLATAIQNMSLPEVEIDRYRWVVRIKRTLTTVVRDDEINEIPLSKTDQLNDVEAVDNDELDDEDDGEPFHPGTQYL